MHHLLVACYTGLSETGCWAGGGGAFVAPPPQVLADQLVLSQLGGGRSCPPNGYLPPPPRIFRPSYSSVILLAGQSFTFPEFFVLLTDGIM